MAGWIKLAVRSFAAGGLFAAAQLGAAQALSMFVWSTAPTPEVWRRQLMWLLFVFAAAVLGGVAGGRRSVRAIRIAIANRRAIAASQRNSGLTLHRSGVRAASRRAVVAAKVKTVDKARGFAAVAALVGAVMFAALGAAAGFVLVWLPARNTFSPVDLRALALTAGIGVGIGSVVSLLSLAAAPIAANACATVVWTWVLGLTSVGLAVATGRPTDTPRLGMLDAPYLVGPGDWWLGPNVMIGIAILIGFAVAATARWIGAHRLGVALSGLAGPAVVAAGYLLVGPTEESMNGYIAALLAATAGLLTSAATAAAHRRDRSAPGAAAALPAGSGTAGMAALPAAPAARPAAPLAIEARPAVPATGRTGRAKAAPAYVAPEPVYVAPARSKPVPAAGRIKPAPRTAPPVPPPAAAPVQAASAFPGGLPGPYIAPPRPTPAPAPRPAPGPPPARPAAPTSAPARPAAPPPPAPPPRPAPPAPARAAPAPAKPAAAPPPAPPAAPPPPAPARSGKPPKPTKPARNAPAAKPAEPAPAKPAEPAPVVPKPVAKATDVPRTAKPAEVVAVSVTTAAAKAENVRMGRRAQRRAAKLAEKRAAEEATSKAREARLRRRSERAMTPDKGETEEALNKREKEHVDWVQHLISLPNDPTLTTRNK